MPDYGNIGRPLVLMEGYAEQRDAQMADEGIETVEQLLEAAHGVDDFTTYLEDIMSKKFYKAYDEYKSNWKNHAMKRDVNDFRDITHTGLGELGDLEDVEEDGDYKFDELGEIAGPVVSTGTKGKLMKVTRKLLINDDLGELAKIPEKMARAAARTLEKEVVALLESNPTAYDGGSMFSTTHGNLLDDVLSERGLERAILLGEEQTNQNGEPTELEAHTLVVPTSKKFTARRIVRSSEVEFTKDADSGKGITNVMNGVVDRIVVEKRLTNSDAWYLYLSADGNNTPAFIVSLLNGKERPDLMRMTQAQHLGDGRFDPYKMAVDELVWKVRHDWGVSAGEWRAAVKSTGVDPDDLYDV